MTGRPTSRWLRPLQDQLQLRFEGRRGLLQVARNAGWLVADKVVRLGVAVFLNVWIARYLGPARFGLFSYAQAIAVLLSFLSTLGLPDIVIRDLAQMHERRRVVLASAFVLRLFGAALVMLVSLGYIIWARPSEPGTWGLVVLFAASQVAQAMDVLDQQYQTINRIGVIVLLRNVNFLVFSAAKVGAILLHGEVAIFAWLYALELFATAGLMYVRAERDGLGFSLGDATRREMRRLMTETAPLILRLAAIGIYIRIDQVMIGRMLGDAQVGLYVAATRLTEPWYLIATAAMMAFVPRLAQIHHFQNDLYEAQLVKVIRVMVWSAAAMATIATVLAPWAVHLLYGERYAAAVPVLQIHAWAAVFSTFGQTVSAWFINKRLIRYGFYQSIIAAALNVAICYSLIPLVGISGAAIAAVVSQFVAGIGANALFAATRPLLRLQLRALAW